MRKKELTGMALINYCGAQWELYVNWKLNDLYRSRAVLFEYLKTGDWNLIKSIC